MGLEYSPAQQMGKSGESMQPSESSTDVACRRARGGHKETKLGGGNQITASAKSENCECERQERVSIGESKDAGRCSTMGTPVPRRGSNLEIRLSFTCSGIRLGSKSDTRYRQ